MNIFKMHKNSFQIIFLLLFGLLVFSNSAMINTFHYDDDLTILNNPAIRQLDGALLWKSFKTRFIPGVSFALNYAFGGLNPQGYHFINVLIHLLTTLLVWGLMKELVRIADNYNLIQEKFSDVFPFLVALVFLVHPVQTEPVNFITQRYVLLAAFFYLATLLLYIKSKLNKSRIYYAGAIITCVLAMFCKEISFTLPFMILIIELFFFRQVGGMTRKKVLILLPFFITLLIIPAALLFTSADMPGTTRIAQIQMDQNRAWKVDITRAASDYSRYEYFLTELNVLRTYMRLLVLPIHQNLDYDYPVYKSLWNLNIFFSVYLIAVCGYLSWRMFSKHRIASFAIVWFFVVLSVESTVIPIAHVIAEYRLYLAVFAFAYLLVFACAQISKDRHGFIMMVICFVVLFSLMTHRRNQVWASRLSLWKDTVEKSPFKSRPNVNLGKLYTQEGDWDRAEQHFLMALKRKPHDWRFSDACTNLGVVYVKKGEIEKAIAMHQEAINLNPRNYLPYYNLGIAYSRQKNYEQEIANYRKALNLNQGAADIHYSLGLAYLDNQQKDQAMKQVMKLKQLGAFSLAKKLDWQLNH